MQPIRSLADVLDDGAFISVERQRRLAELVGEEGPYAAHWDVDLTKGVLTFTGRDGTLETPAHVIGTAAPGPGSWMWGWHDVNGFPDALVARSARVRDLAARFSIAAFLVEEPRAALPAPSLATAATVIGEA